jgi:hypothetical protein
MALLRKAVLSISCASGAVFRSLKQTQIRSSNSAISLLTENRRSHSTRTTTNTRWEATQRVMAAKLTRLTHNCVYWQRAVPYSVLAPGGQSGNFWIMPPMPSMSPTLHHFAVLKWLNSFPFPEIYRLVGKIQCQGNWWNETCSETDRRRGPIHAFILAYAAGFLHWLAKSWSIHRAMPSEQSIFQFHFTICEGNKEVRIT